jgi:hypothetical protein
MEMAGGNTDLEADMNVARALMEGLQAQRTLDELSVLRYALAQDWDDGLRELLVHDRRRDEIVLVGPAVDLAGAAAPTRGPAPEPVLDEPPAIAWRPPIDWVAEAA